MYKVKVNSDFMKLILLIATFLLVLVGFALGFELLAIPKDHVGANIAFIIAFIAAIASTYFMGNVLEGEKLKDIYSRVSEISMAIIMGAVFITFASAPFMALWAFSDYLPFQDEVTVYKMYCSKPRKDGICKGKEETIGRTTFKVFPDQQVVIHWREEIRILQRYSDCVVRDSKNWSCEEKGMFNGKFLRYGFLEDDTYAVPKWRWWWVKLHEDEVKQ